LTPEQITTSMSRALHESLTAEQRAPLERRFRISPQASRRCRAEESRADRHRLPAADRHHDPGQRRDRGDDVPGADFNQALLRTWIGDRPGDTGLRNAMLGARSAQDMRQDSRSARAQ
jgi:hypothetical protein